VNFGYRNGCIMVLVSGLCKACSVSWLSVEETPGAVAQFALPRHNSTARSGGFKLWRTIAARAAQESSRQDHTAAPLPDDRKAQVRATTRIAIKRVQELKRGKGERSNVAVCNAGVCA
jgi:hypothetical protein